MSGHAEALNTSEAETAQLRAELDRLRANNAELRAELQAVQDGLIRFLIPWRSHLPECWLKHLAELGPITFDGIGFVVPNPSSTLAKHSS